MPSVKLVYFPARALGEGLRLMLAYGGQEFEDCRVPMQDWPEYKAKTKFGQLPILEVDGQQMGQSLAIARYLGRRHGLAGQTAEEDFQIDEVMYLINDLKDEAASVHYEPDAARAARLHAERAAAAYPRLLAALERLAGERGGHLALGRLTWADFMFAGMLDYLKLMMRQPDLETSYPSLGRVAQRVLTEPRVQGYLATAPKCEY